MAKARAMATHYIKWADFMVWPDLHQEDWHSAKPLASGVPRGELEIEPLTAPVPAAVTPRPDL